MSLTTQRLFYICLFVLLGLISGCGFHLRGTHHANALKVKEMILLPYLPFEQFYQRTRENLKRAGVDVLLPQDSLNQACPTLTVTKSDMSQHTLVYSLQGQTRRERLQMGLKYTLGLPSSHQDFNQKILCNRDRQLNPNQDLADQYERALLETEMQQELIEQLIQHLSFLPLTESYQCVSSSTNSQP